jgi:phosphoribosylaminoimidazole (AIR) synthetase
MLLIVSPDDVEATLDSLRSQGEAPVEIGEIVSRDHTAPAGQILIR